MRSSCACVRCPRTRSDQAPRGGVPEEPGRRRSRQMRIAILCPTCGWPQRLPALEAGAPADCGRCGSPLRARAHGSLERTAALSLAALILFVPANAYPILRMQFHGAYSESTVWDGCVKLMQQDQWLGGGVGFFPSIAT